MSISDRMACVRLAAVILTMAICIMERSFAQDPSGPEILGVGNDQFWAIILLNILILYTCTLKDYYIV